MSRAIRCAVGGVGLAITVCSAQGAMFTGASGFVLLEVDGGAPAFASSPDPLSVMTTGTTPGSGTTSVSFTESSTSLRLEGAWDGAGTNGFASTASVFNGSVMADATTDVEVLWDLSGMSTNVTWNLLTSGTSATSIVYNEFSGLPTVGSQVFTLPAGDTISFENGLAGLDGRVAQFVTPGELQFIEIRIVPAPGALALLASCGLLARRRRG